MRQNQDAQEPIHIFNAQQYVLDNMAYGYFTRARDSQCRKSSKLLDLNCTKNFEIFPYIQSFFLSCEPTTRIRMSKLLLMEMKQFHFKNTTQV